ncbi:hypothetical protein [Streptomyces nodosus]|nr:hypothetical protein [Streptomyces nodosus]MBB4796092.1 hypothetical protein [Streptomyces nodosus]
MFGDPAQACLAEVSGAEVSRQAISAITDEVLDGMAPASRAVQTLG